MNTDPIRTGGAVIDPWPILVVFALYIVALTVSAIALSCGILVA